MPDPVDPAPSGATLSEIESVKIPCGFRERWYDPAAADPWQTRQIEAGKVVYMFRTNGGTVSDVVREITSNGDGTFGWATLTVNTGARSETGDGGPAGPASPVQREVAGSSGEGGKVSLTPTQPNVGELSFVLAPEPLDPYRIAEYVLNADALLRRRSLTVRISTLVKQTPDYSGEGVLNLGDGPPPLSEAFLSSTKYRAADGKVGNVWTLVLADHWEIATAVTAAYDQAVDAWSEFHGTPGQDVRRLHASMTEMALQAHEAQQSDRPLSVDEVEERRARWHGWRYLRGRGAGLRAYLREAQETEAEALRLGQLLYDHVLPTEAARQDVVDRFSPYLPAPVRHRMSGPEAEDGPGDLDELDRYASAWSETASDGELTAVVGLVAGWAAWTRNAGATEPGRRYVSAPWASAMSPGHYTLNSALLVRRLLMVGASSAYVAFEAAADASDETDGALQTLRRAIQDADYAEDARRAMSRWRLQLDGLRRAARGHLEGLNDAMNQATDAYEQACAAQRSDAGRRANLAKPMYKRLRAFRQTLRARRSIYVAKHSALNVPLPGTPGGAPLAAQAVPVPPPAHLSAKLKTLWVETHALWESMNHLFNDVDFPSSELYADARRYAEAGEAVQQAGDLIDDAEGEVARRTAALEDARRRARGLRELGAESGGLRQALDQALAAERAAEEALETARAQARGALTSPSSPDLGPAAVRYRLTEQLMNQDVDVARVGRGVLRWERAAVGLHFAGAWMAGVQLAAALSQMTAERDGRGPQGYGLVGLEVVGLTSAVLDLSVGLRNLRSVSALLRGRLTTLALARTAGVLETVYFATYATLKASDGDTGAAVGYGVMATGSALAAAGVFTAFSVLGPVGLAVVAIGIVVLIAFSDSELVSWLKRSEWGTEGRDGALDKGLAALGLKTPESPRETERLSDELAELLKIFTKPRVRARLMVGGALYNSAVHTQDPVLVVEVWPGLFDTATMRMDLGLAFSGGRKPVAVQFPGTAEAAGFQAVEADGQVTWVARWPVAAAFSDRVVFHRGADVNSRRVSAEGYVSVTFNEAAVASRPALREIANDLSAAQHRVDGEVGQIANRYHRKDGYSSSEVFDGWLL